MILIGLTSYIPLYVQRVLGTGALVAGFALAGLTLGWPIAASLAGRLYLRLGFRNTALIGTVPVLAGGGLLLVDLTRPRRCGRSASPASSSASAWGWSPARRWWRPRTRSSWENRGVVTGTTMFARSMGSALGIAVFGAIANAALAGRLAGPRADQPPPTSRPRCSTTR